MAPSSLEGVIFISVHFLVWMKIPYHFFVKKDIRCPPGIQLIQHKHQLF